MENQAVSEDNEEFVEEETNEDEDQNLNVSRKRKIDDVDSEENEEQQQESENPENQQARTSENAAVVAKHYNQLQEKGLQERFNSKIFYLRNFNNWIKR
jgi:mRNA (guanine-N7-)-methyltransferase